MNQYNFIGADNEGIYVELIKDGQSIKITLPNNQDYFETNQDTQEVSSSWIEEQFEDLWDMNTLDGVKKLKAENTELRGLLADVVEELLTV